MSARATSRRSRNYDKESGMDRVKKPSSKKVTYVEESDENFSSEEEEQVRTAKKKILKKDFKEDARRKKVRAPSPPSSDNEDENLGSAPTTKSSGTADSSAAKSSGLSVAPHLALLSVIDKTGTIRPVHHALNTFTVNFFVMYNLLAGLEISMVGNTRINNYFGEFFSLGCRIYYGYLGYYQILRAKLAANVPLDAIERRVFRKLETTLPLESCPVAGPLVGWFESLGAYKPEDKTYNWCHPVTQTFTAGHTLFDFAPDGFSYPNIPLMVAVFRSFATATAPLNRYVNSAGYIIPVPNVAAAAVAWLGQQWELDAATASGAGIRSNFPRPGLSFGLPEQVQFLNAAKVSAWLRIGTPTVVQTHSSADLENYLLCAGTVNLNWLRTFRNWANAQSKFAKGSVNLSQISPTCGPSVICITEYDNPAAAPASITEPWLKLNDDYYHDLEFHTRTVSSAVSDADMARAHTYRIVSEVTGQGNRVPGIIPNTATSAFGPLYRYEAANGTYTGVLRNRWKMEQTPAEGMDSDLRDVINTHLFSPMGEDPEPVRTV